MPTLKGSRTVNFFGGGDCASAAGIEATDAISARPKNTATVSLRVMNHPPLHSRLTGEVVLAPEHDPPVEIFHEAVHHQPQHGHHDDDREHEIDLELEAEV